MAAEFKEANSGKQFLAAVCYRNICLHIAEPERIHLP